MPRYWVVGQIYGYRTTGSVIANEQAAAEKRFLKQLRKWDRAASVDPAKTKLISQLKENGK